MDMVAGPKGACTTLAFTSGKFKSPEIIAETKGELGRLLVLSTEGTHVQGNEPRRKLLEHMLETSNTPEIGTARVFDNTKNLHAAACMQQPDCCI